MDILTFISNTIENLAWPVFIFATLVLFRKPITSLIEAIKYAQLKYKKDGVSLDLELKTLEEKHPALPKKAPSEELNKLVKESPIKAIEKSWDNLEETASAAVTIKEPTSLIQIADMLIDKKFLSPSEAEALYDMREIKQEATRPGSIFVTDVSSASTYSSYATGLTEKIREAKKYSSTESSG